MSPIAPATPMFGGARFGAEGVEAAHRLGHARVGRPVAVGRLAQAPEARDRDVDEGRVQRGKRLVAKTEALHGARLEILGHDVEAGHEAAQQLGAAFLLQIDADALLAEVVAQVGRADPVSIDVLDARRCGSSRLAVEGMLHLHHLGTHAREQLRAEGHRLHLFDGEDGAQPGEGRRAEPRVMAGELAAPAVHPRRPRRRTGGTSGGIRGSGRPRRRARGWRGRSCSPRSGRLRSSA